MKVLRRSRWLLLVVPIVVGLLVPIGMRLAWQVQPRQVVEPFILDKTVPDTTYRNHRALHWLLRHEKYTHTTGHFFDAAYDYYGFFPEPSRRYTTRDLSGYSSQRIETFAQQLDFAYFSDAYGVHAPDGYAFEGATTYGYGGLQREELALIQAMNQQGKLVIAEFNVLASPTRLNLRKEAEALLGVTWSGWVGRAFASLDAARPDVPTWLPEQYQRQHGTPWAFAGAGLVFIHETGQVVVLTQETHLDEPWPLIVPTSEAQVTYRLPPETTYSHWFDVVTPHESHHVLASYRLQTAAAGTALLEAHGLSSVFPAIIASPEAPVYYFAGDFADTPALPMRHAQLRGIDMFSSFLYDTDDASDRIHFFWSFYKPLVTNIWAKHLSP